MTPGWGRVPRRGLRRPPGLISAQPGNAGIAADPRRWRGAVAWGAYLGIPDGWLADPFEIQTTVHRLNSELATSLIGRAPLSSRITTGHSHDQNWAAVAFWSWICQSYKHRSIKFCTAFINSSNVSMMNISCTDSVFKHECSQHHCPPVAATNDRNIQYAIASSLEICCKMKQLHSIWINSWSKLFHMVDKTVFQLGMMLVSFGMYLLAFQRSSPHIIDWHIRMVHLHYFHISITV